MAEITKEGFNSCYNNNNNSHNRCYNHIFRVNYACLFLSNTKTQQNLFIFERKLMYNNVSIKYDRGTRQTDDTFLQLQSFSTYILYGIWYIFYHYNIMFQSNDVFRDTHTSIKYHWYIIYMKILQKYKKQAVLQLY